MSKKPSTEDDLWTHPPQPPVNDNVASVCYFGQCPRLHLWLTNDAPYNDMPSGMNAAVLLETADGYDTVLRILGSSTSTTMQVDQYRTEEFNRCQLVYWLYVFFRDHHLWNVRYHSEQEFVEDNSGLVEYVYLTLRYTRGRLPKWANPQGYRTIRPQWSNYTSISALFDQSEQNLGIHWTTQLGWFGNRWQTTDLDGILQKVNKMDLWPHFPPPCL
jgi:hypothetical protein